MMSYTGSGTRNRIDSPRARSDRDAGGGDVEDGNVIHEHDEPGRRKVNRVRVVASSGVQEARHRSVPRGREGAGAAGDDDMGKGRNTLEVDPGVESGDRVHSHDQTQRRAGELRAQRLQRVRGHRRPRTVELAPVGFESGDVGERGFEQAHAHIRRRLR